MPSSEVHFHASAAQRAIVMQSIVGEELAQGLYLYCIVSIHLYSLAARAGFKPVTLRTKGDESTNEPPHSSFYGGDLQPWAPVVTASFTPWNGFLLDRFACTSARKNCAFSAVGLSLWNGTLLAPIANQGSFWH